MEEEDQLACANMIVAFLGEALNDWELAKKYAVDNGVIQDREVGGGRGKQKPKNRGGQERDRGKSTNFEILKKFENANQN